MKNLLRLATGALVALALVGAPSLAATAGAATAAAQGHVAGTAAANAQVEVAAAAATPTGKLTVQVTNAKGGVWKIAGVVVSLRSSVAPFYSTAVTNKLGLASFPKAPAGVKISVQAETWRNLTTYTRPTKSNIVVPVGKLVAVALPVVLGGTVSGKVSTPDGAFRYGQVVAVDPAGATYSATTDGKGNYTIRGIPTGTYVVQFNNHNWADSHVSNSLSYAWSYFGPAHATFQTAKRIVVHMAGATTKQSTVTKINGVVARGALVTFALATPARGGQLNIEKIVSGAALPAETIYSPMYPAGTSNPVRLTGGTYRLAVQYRDSSGATAQYFYTGSGKPLTTDRTKAVLVSVGGSNATVKVGVRP
ncbi:carboxypeptidase regulatory-like domain-containing protein [Glaciihabitans sp. dw_435]|uniref:carboxypeptidase regulatory-like domain-containing protein n=1 Tax=Glaciihabitans sp. dw_435 TaxID=2720081 RepID=UPI001BD1CBAE|nr:carboxypeptidase regulatory-like domain-containing protein [Glaciihabitans sp. dw_435]